MAGPWRGAGARVRHSRAGRRARALRAGARALRACAALSCGALAFLGAPAGALAGGVRCTPPKLNISAALGGGRVTVSPAPQSRDATAGTQISLLGTPLQEIAGVTVRGSRTGPHSGELRAYSQGDGASFLPQRPFAQGETVRVSARLLQGAGSIPISWSFTIAHSDHSIASGSGGGSISPSQPHQSFVSRPDLRPPVVTVSPRGAATGDVFLAPYSGGGQYGPMILDQHGGLLWFDPLPAGARAADLRVQSYEGRPVLTWWQDPLVAGGSADSGEVIADSSYRQIAVVRAGNGYQSDLHEFQITPQGTGLMTVYDAIDCDLSSVGGPREGAVADTLFQELDLHTGLVRYEWHFLDHVSITSSYASARPTSLGEPFDPFHINSVDVEQDGSLLVDARNTWAAYDVDAGSGQVRWALGGRHSSFKLGPGVATAWQHDAREQPDGAITFFDNGATPKVHPDSRAIEVVIDPLRRTARLARSYEHSNPLVAGSQGNLQAFADGDWMVGWGQAGYFSEVDAAGNVLFNAHLPPGWETYRTYVQPWSGHPAQAPRMALARHGAGHPATAYVSWNGATEVASWRVLSGATAAALSPALSARRAGFETAIALPSAVNGRYVAVQALSASGVVLGVSVPARL
jgi:hypothetical protein